MTLTIDDIKAAAERLIREAQAEAVDGNTGGYVAVLVADSLLVGPAALAGLDMQDALQAAERRAAALEPFTENDLAILYRLIDQYTEAAYADLPRDDASHATREALREKVTRHLIAAREALAAMPADAGAVEAPSHDFMECQPGSCALPHPLPAPDESGCHWPYGNIFFGGTRPYREGDPICMLTRDQHQDTKEGG